MKLFKIKITIIATFLLISCSFQDENISHPNPNKTDTSSIIQAASQDQDSLKRSTKNEKQKKFEDQDLISTAVKEFKEKVDPIDIPVTIGSEDNPKDTWLKLTDSTFKRLDLEDYLEVKDAPVYAIGQLKLNGCWGIVYHFQYIKEPINESNYDQKRNETFLVLYDELNVPQSVILLALHELSNGYSKINSPSEISYVHWAEMENIRVKVIHYHIQDGSYTQNELDYKEFNGDKKGSEKAEAYVQKHLTNTNKP